MTTMWFRRFRMEFDFAMQQPAEPELPDGYRWIAWNPVLLERHSITKWESFRYELDSSVFPCLGDLGGCRRLMREIVHQKTFLPGCTWLISFHPEPSWPPADCATIQGMQRSRRFGSIQNVGVVPEHRGFGLGRALVLQSLHGFRDAGLSRVYLEVTAENAPAVELYQSIGFRLVRTQYKAVDVYEEEKQEVVMD